MGAVQINLIMLSFTVISATPADDASSRSQNLLYWWLRTSPVLRTCPGKPPARWRGTASFAISLGEVMWPSAPRPVYGSSAQWHSWQQPPAGAAGPAGQEACYPADFRPVRPWEEMHTRRSPDSFAQVQSPMNYSSIEKPPRFHFCSFIVEHSHSLFMFHKTVN